MPRRARESDDDVSLFPFLSIIACVIGVLTMMISTLALAQMDTDDVAVIEAHEKVSAKLSEKEAELARLRALLDEKFGPDATQVRENLDQSKEEVARLATELEQIQKELEEQQKVKVVIPTVDPMQRETVNEMQSQYEELTEQLAQLEKDLKQRKDATESKTTILPGGTGLRFKPQFVECAEDSLVLHMQSPPKRLRRENMVNDPDFIKLMESVANSTNETITFLVREDGIGTYYAAKKLCDEKEVRNGKLPVIGAGRIDLSGFRK